MQHSTVAAKEEGMATLHGGQVLRQYCNKRTRAKQNEICTSPKGMDKEKDQSSIFTSPVQVEDSHPTKASELKSSSNSKLSQSQPQVIVRKFTLPQFSNAYSLPIRPKKNTDFGKPKQRWKHLCNLQHEMTTTLGVPRVKMLGPSTPLTKEYLPGTLQSYAGGTLDVMNSTLQQLLMRKEFHVYSPTQSKEENSVLCVSSPLQIEPVLSSDDTADSKIDYVDVDQILDTAEEVPEIAAVAEVSSAGGTVTFGPFDTARSNIGIVRGKFVIFQPLPGTEHIVQQEGGSPKVNTIVLKSSQSAAIEAVSGTRVIKPFMDQKEVSRSLLKTNLMQGNVTPCSEFASKEHGVGHKNSKHCFEPVMKEQNVVWGSMKHNSPSVIKEQNVIWANQKHNSEPNTKQQNVIQGDVKHASEKVKLGNLKNDTEPGGKHEQNVKLGNSRNDTDPAVTEQNVTAENLKHDHEPSSKDQNVSHGNLKSVSEPTSKEKNIVAVHPVPQEPDCLKVAHDCMQDVLTKSPQTAAVVIARQTSAQSKNSQPIKPSHEPTEDASAEWKQLEQLHLEILKMKRRRNIALKVERDVLRAKDVKLVQEVLLPARKVLLSEMGTQTNLFSLVESGRMVEMKISTDKTEELGKMVSSRTKHMAEENIAVMQKPCGYVLNSGTPPTIILSGCGKKLMAGTGGIDEKGFEKNVSLRGGMTAASDEPDKKKVRMGVTLKSQNDAGGSVTSDIGHTQSSSGTVSFGSGNDATNMEFQSSSEHKKMDVMPLNTSLETSEAEILHNFKVVRNTNIAVKVLPGVTDHQASSKPLKFGTNINNEKERKSVYDIIVEHNIAAQVRKSQPKQKMMINGSGGNENKTAPMVYFPDSDLSNTPRNTNTSEIAAKITDGLVRQAYEDWVRCSIPDESGNIPLHKAVINENITLVKRQCVVLCARKSKLDVYNFDKETPLHLAVLSGNAEIAQMLISFGAQPSVKDSNGNTALHLAVLHGNLDCVKAILNTNNTKSLPLDDFNDEGYSPMHLCALNGKVEEMKCLIVKGAEVNLKDAKSGRTALFHAVEANNCDLVHFLLACDANPNEPNFSGHTPLSAASEISFTSRNTTKEYSISDGINFSSKLVPLSRGSSVTHTLDEGSSIVFEGELLEDVCMDEVHENDLAQCYSSATMNGSSNSSSNNNNPWFLNE